MLFKVAQKDIFPIYLNCIIFFSFIFPSIYIRLEYYVLWGKRISFTIEKKKTVSYFTFVVYT